MQLKTCLLTGASRLCTIAAVCGTRLHAVSGNKQNALHPRSTTLQRQTPARKACKSTNSCCMAKPRQVDRTEAVCCTCSDILLGRAQLLGEPEGLPGRTGWPPRLCHTLMLLLLLLLLHMLLCVCCSIFLCFHWSCPVACRRDCSVTEHAVM